MNTIVPTNSAEENRFKTISEFKWWLKCEAEIEFDWEGRTYGMIHPKGHIIIWELPLPGTRIVLLNQWGVCL